MRHASVTAAARFLALAAVLPLLTAGPAAAKVSREQAQGFYEDAVERFRSNNFVEAEIQLRNALQGDPNNLPARILLGKALLHNDQPHAAIHEFDRARSIGGDENLFAVEMANAYLRIAEPEEVIAQFKPENHPEKVAGGLYLAIGEAHVSLNNLEEAQAAFVQSASRLPLDARPVIGRARVALRQGKYIRAEKLLRTAVVLGPEYHDAWLLKGVMHRDRGQFEQARVAFDKAIELRPNSVRALVGRSAMWMGQGDFAQARADLERARELGAPTLEFIYLNALMLFQSGKPEEARESLRASAADIEEMREEVREKLPKVELMLGVVSYFENNHDRAVEHLRRYLAGNPRHAGARRYLASAYLALKDYDDVIALYRPGSGGVAPRGPAALALVAEAYRAKGDLERAEELVRHAPQMSPGLARVGIRLALERLDSGRPGKAVADLEKLAEKFPDAPELRAQLARAYVKTGELDRARELTDAIVESLPEDSRAAVLAGTVYLMAGDAAAARASFERAVVLDPDRITPRVNLARLDALEGKPALAERRYRDILDRYPQHATSGIELTRLLLGRNDLEAAEYYAEETVEANPGRIDAHQVRLDVMLARDVEPEDLSKALTDVLDRFQGDYRADLMAGRMYRRLGERDQARDHFRLASEGMPTDGPRLHSLAQQQFGIADYEGARETLIKAARAAPEALDILVLRAASESQLQRFDTARSYILRATELHGERASILTVAGDVYMAQDRPAEATAAYQRAFEISPNARTVLTLVRARVANGEVDQAVKTIDAWLADNPRHLEARDLYARLMVRERRWEKAKSLLESMLEAGVRDPYTLNNLAVVYQRLGDSRALMMARSAYDRAPENPAFIDTYGWVLAENGDPKKGLALLRDAFSRMSTEPEIRFHIGLALSRIEGRESEAVEELRAALAQADLAAPWREEARKVLESIDGS